MRVVTGLTKTESALLAGFAAIVAIPVLYMARQFDNNSLTSWRWVFTGQSIGVIILIYVAAAGLSYWLSKKEILEDRPVFSLFCLSLLIGISVWQEPELLLDSSRYLLQAKHVNEYGLLDFFRQWGRELPAWTDMPLVPFIYGFIFKIFGENRAAVQLYNVLIFSFSTVLTYLTARFFMGKKNGINAALFLLGMPYLLTQIPLFLVDVHVLFFLNMALYSFLRVMHDGGFLNTTWAAGSIALAMLAKFSTWPMLVILPLLAAVSLFQGSPRVLARALLVFTAAGILSGLYLIPKLPLVLEQISLLRSYQGPALQVWRESLVSTFLFQIHPFIFFFAAVFLLFSWRKEKKQLFIIGLFVLFFCCFIQRIRYIIPLLPLLAILAASGLKILRFAETRRLVCWLCLVFALIILHGAYLPFFNMTSMANIKKAGQYLETIDSEAVEVYTLPQKQTRAPTYLSLPQLDLFTDKTLIAPQEWSSAANRPQGYHPLLFAWELKKPSSYSGDRAGNSSDVPLVVISGMPVDEAVIHSFRDNPSYTTVRHFNACSRVFRYKTFITVFH